MVREESWVWREFLNTIYIIPLNHLTTVLLLSIQPLNTFQNSSKKISGDIGAIIYRYTLYRYLGIYNGQRFLLLSRSSKIKILCNYITINDQTDNGYAERSQLRFHI